MVALLTAMALLVAFYYGWPAAAKVLSIYASWQESGGVLAAAVATAIAGGVLSELSIVYMQNGGRWVQANFENILFKLGIFFISGGLVYEFYQWQAVYWGQGVSWSVIAKKVLTDQFVFSTFWSAPFNTVATRWQVLGYSLPRLWSEFDRYFVIERVLPVLGANWMFWFPAVILVYAMPLQLQTPLFIFATATWGLLLPAVSRQDRALVAPSLAAQPVVAADSRVE